MNVANAFKVGAILVGAAAICGTALAICRRQDAKMRAEVDECIRKGDELRKEIDDTLRDIGGEELVKQHHDRLNEWKKK